MEDNNYKLRLFYDSEYQLEDPELSTVNVFNEENDEIVVDDIYNAYCKEIGRYSLLSSEDEVYYGQILKDLRDNALVLFRYDGKRDIPTLNTSKLFRLICNSPLYKDVIDNLLLFYGKLHSDNDKSIDELIKYRNESKKVNQALNEEELTNIFNIDCSENIDLLEGSDLLKEVKDFMNFKYAFTKFFVSNLRLVVSRAKIEYLKKPEMCLMDLISEGNIGLIRAINGYDVSFRKKFSTYATPCIKTAIENYIDGNTCVKFSSEVVRNNHSFRGKSARLMQEQQKTLNAEELAEEMNIPVSLVNEYLAYMTASVSLDQPISADKSDDYSLLDTIADNTTTEDIVMDNMLEENINFLYTLLTPNEKEVVLMMFGLGKYQGKQYKTEDIAKVLDVSKQRINQLKTIGLIKMKNIAKAHIKKGLF